MVLNIALFVGGYVAGALTVIVWVMHGAMNEVAEQERRMLENEQ